LDDAGELLTMEEQDRSRWDEAAIREGLEVLESALHRRQVGPYQLQAAIAACHAQAKSTTETDWEEIAGIYALLERQMPSPVVTLNRAVAVAFAGNIGAGLAIIEELADDARLQDYYLLEAARADLLRRRTDYLAATECYERALQLAPSDVERRYLLRRLREVAIS
jgi:RNA polymerase sigma-70 factor (ECF subfamily)